MAYTRKNLCIMGFNTSTCLMDEMKTIKNFNPEIIHIIGISGSETWLEKINDEFKTSKINIIECDEIMKGKLKPCFYKDLENHAINILYDYFIDKKMFMEAFICTRFLNMDLMSQKKYVLASVSEMVEKVMDSMYPKDCMYPEHNLEEGKKQFVLCPWKIITPSIIGNLISNLNEMKFSDTLTMVLNYDDINTHKVSLVQLLNQKGEADSDIYNHALSILIKIWILENYEKKKIDKFSDTLIFCLNIVVRYLYNNKRIHDIFQVWEFYKFDIDMNNTDTGYILLYYSRYLSHVDMLDEAAKFLLKAVELNKDLDKGIKEIVENNKSTKTKL